MSPGVSVWSAYVSLTTTVGSAAFEPPSPRNSKKAWTDLSAGKSGVTTTTTSSAASIAAITRSSRCEPRSTITVGMATSRPSRIRVASSPDMSGSVDGAGDPARSSRPLGWRVR